MGCSYEVRGLLTVKNCEETQIILKVLEELVFEDDELTIETTDTVINIELNINNQMAYSTASDIDGTLEKFNPYCVEGADIDYSYDGEPGKMFLGSKEQIALAQSHHSLYLIMKELPYLNEEDKERLKDNV